MKLSNFINYKIKNSHWGYSKVKYCNISKRKSACYKNSDNVLAIFHG